MFIREVKNRSGSVSIQIISKNLGRYKVVRTVGCATTRQEIDTLKKKAKQELEAIKEQPSLFLKTQYFMSDFFMLCLYLAMDLSRCATKLLDRR